MHDAPSPAELVEAVKKFIDEAAAPQLTGHAAFHARVASNALATVLRDLEARQRNDTAEQAGLTKLLDRDGELDNLIPELCKKIQAGEMTVDTPGLLAHLKQTAIAQVKVDQPKYSGLRTALESE